MWSDQTPILGLPLILPSQAQKHVTHNEALRLLDAVCQLTVLDLGIVIPPAAPELGDRYILGAGASGEWAGHDGDIAVWSGVNWDFVTPAAGWIADVQPEGRSLRFDGTAWQPLDLRPATLGVSAEADATNRLAVSADATLLNHAGTGHQLKLNKATEGDTASLLYQTGWSGRAELGTAGTDDFALKLSGDGTTWRTALAFDANTAAVSGESVQQSATDATPGRLMRADFGYSRGNILGPVTMSGNTPSGAVIERGSNANGEYVRFADGTQICTHAIPLGSIVAAGGGTWDNPYRTAPDVNWTFPAAFANTPVVQGRGIPPSGLGANPERRRNMPSIGRANALTLYQLHLVRLGSAPDADTFEIGLTAIGRWF